MISVEFILSSSSALSNAGLPGWLCLRYVGLLLLADRALCWLCFKDV
jgi:hypothetical protein